MAARGWRAIGIEPVGSGRCFARHNFGLDIRPGPLENAGMAEKTFDLVSLFYVIEHLPDPLATVRHVHRLLKPGGMILLRWPHTTPLVQLLGPLSRGLDLYHTPYHLFDFSPASMRHMLDCSGFERVETVPGGYTLPPKRLKRWISQISAVTAEGLFRLSGRSWLLPGISKTTVAFKAPGGTANASIPSRPGRS
jgi:SAM-dependent methyltransferase